MLAGHHPLALFKINPMNPKTKVVDPSKTTAAEFLSGAPSATPALAPKEAVEAASRPAPEPPVDDEQSPVQPARPLADPAATPAASDPFVLLWKHPQGTSSIRAMAVPGGCIVQRAWLSSGQAVSGALCFVPNVRIEGDKLVGDTSV